MGIRARKSVLRPGIVMRTTSSRPAAQPAQATGGDPIRLTATNSLLHGDVTDMLRRHVADGFADLAIADVPYFLHGPQDAMVAEPVAQQQGKKPMFNEGWDRFSSIEDYEEFCATWIRETMRCLNPEGSLFIFGTHHNIGFINRLCQIKKYVIINEIIWVRRNSRPNVATRRLQASHQSILWIAKDEKQYRFNYRLCKRTQYDDWLSKRNQPARDVMDIVTNSHENKGRHPSPKPLAVYDRLLDVAGKPGGLLLDLFSGSGTGAVCCGSVGDAFDICRKGCHLRSDDPNACWHRGTKENTITPVAGQRVCAGSCNR